MKSRNKTGGLAYSTEKCSRCGWPKHQCACSRPSSPPAQDKGRRRGKGTAVAHAPPKDGVVRVERQTKGRKGKGVTVIHGVPLEGDDLKALAKALKARCGSGGTVKQGTIEIQGDHRDTVIAELKTKGWTVKRSGG